MVGSATRRGILLGIGCFGEVHGAVAQEIDNAGNYFESRTTEGLARTALGEPIALLIPFVKDTEISVNWKVAPVTDNLSFHCSSYHGINFLAEFS